MRITEQDRQAILDIQGMAGFRVIKYLVEQRLNKVKDVTSIVKESPFTAGEQAAGKVLAVEMLEELFSDLNLLERPIKETNKTYE